MHIVEFNVGVNKIIAAACATIGEYHVASALGGEEDENLIGGIVITDHYRANGVKRYRSVLKSVKSFALVAGSVVVFIYMLTLSSAS